MVGWALVTMVIVQVLGASGIEMGAKILAVFVLAEFSVLIVFALVTLFKGGGPEGLGLTDSLLAVRRAPGRSRRGADVRRGVDVRLRGHRHLRRGGP